jgi:hypothetical protein
MKQSIAAAAIAALLALGTASQAAAVTVLGAKSVTITSAIPNYLQVGELIAADYSAVDVALATNGATASASSIYHDEALPGFAIDGAYPADYPNIFHSATDGAGEYLTVTFAAAHNLASLTIYGRNHADSFCCRQRDFYDYSIFDADGALLASGQLDARSSEDTSATVFFDQAATTAPEPATWALMIMGLGGVGAVLRRRSVLTHAA